MKCITVHQPWATLLACGEKQFESRSWHTHYTGPVAIHAGKTFHPDVIRLCRDEPFLSALLRHGVRSWEDLPLGYIVGVAEMVACHPTEIVTPAPLELAFGDWRPGRYAWELRNPSPLVLPIPMRGQLSLFDLPEHVLAQLREVASHA